MNKRSPAEEITPMLTTKSDKIRALALAGYDRIEISKILGLRYQHVRNVMLRSGIVGGLRREVVAEREPVEVDAAPAPRARIPPGKCSATPALSSSENGRKTRKVSCG